MNPKPDYVHNTFWQKDQVSITFEVHSDEAGNFPHIEEINRGLQQQRSFLNSQIEDLGLVLNFFLDENTRTQAPSHPPELDSSSSILPPGVYLFPPSSSSPRVSGTVPPPAPMISFLSLHPLQAKKDMDIQSETGSTQGNYNDDPKLSPVVLVVNQINRLLQAKQIPQEMPVSILATSPNWLCGATQPQPDGPLPVGCPLLPPIPVPADATCPSSPGLWPITLPNLPPDLLRKTGDGVTVFILDTLPRREQITRAAQAASDHNLLLLDIANNDRVQFHYNFLPDVLDLPNQFQPRVGKDIKGRLFGFRLPDHGLFAAGIVHDLAPDANIECVRVLNDLCVGDSETLTRALQSIFNRMSQVDPGTNKLGDLYNKPIVINLSLVIPPDKEVADEGLDTNDLIRVNVLKLIQNLVNLGAIFVASAGNEGDMRYNPMMMQKLHPNAYYPAAFAYRGLKLGERERMIPVGAVDKNGKATDYSCYPGPRGVATYGGDLPRDSDIKVANGVTEVTNIDALIGVYTSLSYPALSIEDTPSSSAAPNANSWAYWVGTSFATPIVSAVAACAWELKLRNPDLANKEVSQIVIDSANKQTTEWTNLAPDGTVSKDGPVIKAVQLQAKE